MHLHVSVPELAQSIRFYETLFGAPPTVVKGDYAKWMLEDPCVNFAISQRGAHSGVDHIGIQVESAAELGELADRLKSAGAQTFDQEGTTCCYARSDKSWVTDPAGVRWETFFTFGQAIAYGEDAPPLAEVAASPTNCCGAARNAEPAACC
jgi:catechol 2,3-dioxygenase-like lactoylglutathione lyase family enzyme